MTPQEIAAAVRSIEFGWPLKCWDACAYWRRDGFGRVLLGVSFRTSPHRDTGAVSRGVNEVYVTSDDFVSVMTADHLRDVIYGMARRLLLHELDESWLVGGVRVKDPHAESSGGHP